MQGQSFWVRLIGEKNTMKEISFVVIQRWKVEENVKCRSWRLSDDILIFI